MMPQTDSEYEKAIDRLVYEMQAIRRQTAEDQHEVERLRAETRVILDRLKVA